VGNLKSEAYPGKKNKTESEKELKAKGLEL
jgi:hypothetical protein